MKRAIEGNYPLFFGSHKIMTELEKRIIEDNFEGIEELVQDIELPIIAIPSYKNRKKSNIHNLVSSLPNVRFYLFVYSDDIDNYQEYQQYSNLDIIVINPNKLLYKGITAKRHYIIQYFNAMNVDKFIMLDDDTNTQFNRTIKQEGKRTGRRTKVDIWLAFKILIKLLEGKEYGIAGFYRDSFINFWNRKEVLKLDVRITNAIIINLESLRLHKINYDLDFKAGEDCDIIYQCYANNLPCYCLPFIANTFTITSGSKQSTIGTINEWRQDWIRLFAKWKGFIDLVDYPDKSEFKYKELNKNITSNDPKFKDKAHEERWKLVYNTIYS